MKAEKEKEGEMMKYIMQRVYMCELCETEYDYEELANKCEKNHVLPKRICDMDYMPYVSDKYGEHGKYPFSISVEFKDGSTLDYSEKKSNDMNFQQTLTALAAYRDTGFTPQEIMEMAAKLGLKGR